MERCTQCRAEVGEYTLGQRWTIIRAQYDRSDIPACVFTSIEHEHGVPPRLPRKLHIGLGNKMIELLALVVIMLGCVRDNDRRRWQLIRLYGIGVEGSRVEPMQDALYDRSPSAPLCL